MLKNGMLNRMERRRRTQQGTYDGTISVDKTNVTIAGAFGAPLHFAPGVHKSATEAIRRALGWSKRENARPALFVGYDGDGGMGFIIEKRGSRGERKLTRILAENEAKGDPTAFIQSICGRAMRNNDILVGVLKKLMGGLFPKGGNFWIIVEASADDVIYGDDGLGDRNGRGQYHRSVVVRPWMQIYDSALNLHIITSGSQQLLSRAEVAASGRGALDENGELVASGPKAEKLDAVRTRLGVLELQAKVAAGMDISEDMRWDKFTPLCGESDSDWALERGVEALLSSLNFVYRDAGAARESVALAA